jgi:hypothetical protein
MSGYIPTRRDKIGVPIVNFVARLVLTKEYQRVLKHAAAVGIAVNRVARKEADDDRP